MGRALSPAAPAEPRRAGDGCQRPLRSRFPPRLTPSVRHPSLLIQKALGLTIAREVLYQANRLIR
jgi:hypothetical protein